MKKIIVFCLLSLSACSSGGSSGGSVGNGAYRISGTVTSSGAGLDGATVTLSGAATGTATTDFSGNYSFTGTSNGNYTITTTKIGYIFVPDSISIVINNSNSTGKNFTATKSMYNISGSVIFNGTPLAGVTVKLFGAASDATKATATTDVNGNYSIPSTRYFDYSIIPTKTGFYFTPSNLRLDHGYADSPGKNFIASSSSAKLPKTGQSYPYNVWGDGDYQVGVAWPTPRFTDNADGTVTDNLTDLIWLKNANCFGTKSWSDALTVANTLANGTCGLSDGSIAGQWRLPNLTELESLIDISRNSPAIPSYHPFVNVRLWNYLTSSSYVYDASWVWEVSLDNGAVGYGFKSDGDYVWPVRSGL